MGEDVKKIEASKLHAIIESNLWFKLLRLGMKP